MGENQRPSRLALISPQRTFLVLLLDLRDTDENWRWYRAIAPSGKFRYADRIPQRSLLGFSYWKDTKQLQQQRKQECFQSDLLLKIV